MFVVKVSTPRGAVYVGPGGPDPRRETVTTFPELEVAFDTARKLSTGRFPAKVFLMTRRATGRVLNMKRQGP